MMRIIPIIQIHLIVDSVEDPTDDDQADDQTIGSSSPEQESSRKYRLVKTMEKLYNTYGDKIKV